MPIDFFSILWMSLVFTVYFLSLKSSLLAKYLSAFVIPAGLRSAGFEYLTKHHLKHSLSSSFWILINPFAGWSNSFGNLIELLPAKGLYVWSMTESKFQSELFQKVFVCLL